MLGAVGPAILLVFSLIATVLSGILLAILVAHYFLVSFEDTAIGEDSIAWNSEPIFELLWKPIYLLGILLAPLAPLAVLLVAAVPALANDWRGAVVLIVIMMWLAFPVLFLSSYFSGRWWSLHTAVIMGLACQRRAALLYLVLSAGLLTATTICGWFLVCGNYAAIFTSAVIAGALPLLHGRLLGRLAWLLDQRCPREKRHKPRRKKIRRAEITTAPAETDVDFPMPVIISEQFTANDAAVQQPAFRIPDGPLEDVEDEWDMYKKPYRMMTDTEVEIEAMKKAPGDPGVIGPLTSLPTIGLERKPKGVGKKRQSRSLVDVFFVGVWIFPFLGANVGKWLNLSFLLLFFAVVLRMVTLVWIV